MKRGLTTISLLFIASHIVVAQFAHPYALAPSIKADSAAVSKTQQTVQTMMDKARIPGLSIAVAKDGSIVYSEGFGLADIENGHGVFPNTKFRIGSISKTLTAALLMDMYQEHQIELDAPIKKYLPLLPNSYADITLRQLAGHLAGVRHYKSGEYFRTEQYDSIKESLEIFINDSLLHEPETKYKYSTYGYVLLSAVLEGAAKMSFLKLMQKKVLAPLGMSTTVAEYADRIIYHRAEFYRANKENKLVNAPSENYSYKWAGGGYLSTAEDLANFGTALLNARFISHSNVNLMFTSQETISGEQTGYGIGWEIGKDWEGRAIVKHGGSSSGARSFIMLYPNQNLVIVILSNKDQAPIFEGEAGVIADYFLNKTNVTHIDQKIEGVYAYQRTVNDQKMAGTLNIIKQGDAYTGTISNFYSSTAPIVNVQMNKDQVVISAVTPSGIANFWLVFDDKGFTGKSGWSSPSQKIIGTKLN